MASVFLIILFITGALTEATSNERIARLVERSKLTSRDVEIVGGNTVSLGEYPFIAAVASDAYGVFCGASLIDPHWVLTAAHCFDDYDKVQFLCIRFCNHNLANQRSFHSFGPYRPPRYGRPSHFSDSIHYSSKLG